MPLINGNNKREEFYYSFHLVVGLLNFAMDGGGRTDDDHDEDNKAVVTLLCKRGANIGDSINKDIMSLCHVSQSGKLIAMGLW